MNSRPTSPAYGSPWQSQAVPGRSPSAGFGRLAGPLRDDYDAESGAQDGPDSYGWVQWDVFRRLQEMNLRHAGAAWNYRYSMPLAPYALAFLYGQPDRRRGGTRATAARSRHAGPEAEQPLPRLVTAATRLWHAGPEAEHPIPLLAKFTDVATAKATDISGLEEAGPTGRQPERAAIWDLRDDLADRRDDAMTPDATYLGLGYSTLNTPQGSFADICQTATSELNVPGVFCYVANPSGDVNAADHRVFTAERRAAADHNTVTIHSWQAFTTPQLTSPLAYSQVPADFLYRQSPYALVLQAMWRLDQALRAADTARVRAQGNHRTHRRGPG
jgi:hypothetical protein